MMSAREKEVSYFKFTPLYWWVLICGAIGFLGILVFCPEVVPYSQLGPVGDFLYYLSYSQHTLLKIGLGVVFLIHIGEAWYAYILTRRMNLNTRDTILWTAQTFIVGFSSLIPLKRKCSRSSKRE